VLIILFSDGYPSLLQRNESLSRVPDMEQIKTLLELQNGKLEAQPSPKILAQRQREHL
jgi:hypothetical protein